jgi:hypothetical protein
MARKRKPLVLHKDWLDNLSLSALDNMQASINDGCMETSIYVIENRNKIDLFIKNLGEISVNESLSNETQFSNL